MTPPAQAATSLSPRTAERMARLEGELDAHKQVDDLRFATLTASIWKVETGLDGLKEDVRDGFDRLGAAVQDINLKLAGSGEVGAVAPRIHWRIGPFGQWAIGLGALALLAVMGWMATQLWLEEPARIKAAQAVDPAVIARAR
jgi:hypothetical protein